MLGLLQMSELLDEEWQQMMVEARGSRGPSRGLKETICLMQLSENIDQIFKADFYNPQAGHYAHLNSFKFPILKLLQLGDEHGVLSSLFQKEEQKQDQCGWKKKARWVPKRDRPARPVGGPNDEPRPGGPFTTPKQRPKIFRADEQDILNKIKVHN
nr:legumin A [Tanacetum cinerariifolium]